MNIFLGIFLKLELHEYNLFISLNLLGKSWIGVIKVCY